jgi:hypothetical protein
MTTVHTNPIVYKLIKQACAVNVSEMNMLATKCSVSSVCESGICHIPQGDNNQKLLSLLKNKTRGFLFRAKMRNMKGILVVLALSIFAFTCLPSGKSTKLAEPKINTINNHVTGEEAGIISPLVIVDKYMLQ